MENLEKVEKLRERAEVSYEEAKAALEENNWDLLDAMVSLEKQGRTKKPEQTTYSTSYDEQEHYEPVKETVYEGQKKEKEGVKGYIRRFIDICRNNSFCVKKNEDTVMRIPVLLLVVILLFTWRIALPVLVIGLFFRLRYSFEGKDDLSQANDLMDSASNAAERVKEEFTK
ncbi:MAG: ubiquitin [Blautia sp.]|nr:ubiquitin [Blautia sp.]